MGKKITLKLALATSALALAWSGSAYASTAAEADASDAADAPNGGEIIVQARNRTDKIGEVAGNVSVISADQVEGGRAGNVADALRFQPGLVAQSATGGEAVRFSMRGSGVIRSPFAWGTGIQMLLDGLPMTTAEGSPFEYYDALANNYTEVYRGANAFDFSPTTQGGAINYVPHSGYDSTPLLARAEFGSVGYKRAQVSSGAVLRDVDYYVSGNYFETDGFRNNTASHSTRVVASLGWKVAPDVKLRTYGVYVTHVTNFASGITWNQLENNPVLNPVTFRRNSPGSILLGAKLDWAIDGSSNLAIGAVYKHYKAQFTLGVADRFDIQDIAGSVRFTKQHSLFGRPAKTEAAFLYSALLPGSNDRKYSADLSVLRNITDFRGVDATFLLKNDLELVDGFWLTTGLAVIEQSRKSHISRPTTDFRDEAYSNFAPRIGARVKLGNAEFFANYGRSVEAPIAHALPQSVGGLYTYNAHLKEQVQDTLEAGIRGKIGGLQWSAAVYRAWVRDEILNVEIAPATSTSAAVIQASNAKAGTIHQGIELSVDGTLFKSGHFAVSTQHALSLNDFHYRNEPTLGNAQLPAIPRALYQGAVRVDHDSGVFVGIGTEALLSRYAADFANTIWVKPYALLDLRAGWSSADKKWQVFVDAKNATGKRYASVVSPIYNARGIDSAAYFPGQGANVTFGITKAF